MRELTEFDFERATRSLRAAAPQRSCNARFLKALAATERVRIPDSCFGGRPAVAGFRFVTIVSGGGDAAEAFVVLVRKRLPSAQAGPSNNSYAVPAADVARSSGGRGILRAQPRVIAGAAARAAERVDSGWCPPVALKLIWDIRPLRGGSSMLRSASIPISAGQAVRRALYSVPS